MNRDKLLELIANRADHITSALAATGKTINFRDADLRPLSGGGEENGGAFLDFGKNQATVWSANGQPLHNVFHVLLHLHRYWVEGIPQLWHETNGCAGALLNIENAYENLVIIPVEIAHYPEAFSYWVNYAEEKLYQCQEKRLAPATLKSQLFRLYLLAQTAFPKSQVADSVSVEVWKKGLMDEYEAVADIVFKNYEHKAFSLETLCLFVGVEDLTPLGLRHLERLADDSGDVFRWLSLKDVQICADKKDQSADGASANISSRGASMAELSHALASDAAFLDDGSPPKNKIRKKDKPDLAAALSRSPLTGQTAEEKAKILPRMAFGNR